MWFLDGEFVAGVLISVVTIAMQALATVAIVKLGHVAMKHKAPRHKIPTLILLMGAAGSLLTLAHAAEAAVWAAAYVGLGVIGHKDAYYFAFVNFTTLGYGDLLPEHRWRMLGPITAANGMLLFGWSTAVLFAVLSRALRILHLE